MTYAIIALGFWFWVLIALTVLSVFKAALLWIVLFWLWLALGATFGVWLWVDTRKPRKIVSPHGLISPPSNLDLLRTRTEHPQNADRNPDKKADKKADSDGVGTDGAGA